MYLAKLCLVPYTSLLPNPLHVNILCTLTLRENSK